MQLTDEQVKGLNVACNEATWIGLEIDQEQAWAGITLSVLTLPAAEGPAPEDSRVQLILQPLSRLCASYRNGYWNDEAAEVLPLTPQQLQELIVTVQDPVYGWDFFNSSDEDDFLPWADRLSLDIRPSPAEPLNTINLFQDRNPVLDVRIWFGQLRIFGPDRKEIDPQSFIDGGRRWWDAMYAGDPRTKGSGIVPG
jgi:hypothetical protein